MSEGILLQDVDADVETVDSDEAVAVGQLDAGDEVSKKTLRDQLRRTLKSKPSKGVYTHASHLSGISQV